MNKVNFSQFFYLFILFICLIFAIFNQEKSNGIRNNKKENLSNNKENYKVKEGSVYDGDTLRVLSSSNEELKIRFACIDAPEKKMEYGIESRDYLRSLLQSSGNKVNLDIITTDRYGRSVAVLYLLNGEAVQTLQVKNGWVYPYEEYSSSCPIWDEIKKAEKEAINNGVNIYSQENKNLEKPSEYRRRKREAS